VELANPITVVTGHEMLTCIFGRWPSFHDAEVVDLAIWRGDVDPDRKKYTFPVLTAKVLVNELVPEQTNESRLRIVPQAHVTFRFYDVDDLKLDGFNHVIGDGADGIAAADVVPTPSNASMSRL
jgi:hypothetical protein